MKDKLIKAKNHIKRNKTTYIVGAVTSSVIVLQHAGIKSLNQFLAEKNLLDEYYQFEEEE